MNGFEKCLADALARGEISQEDHDNILARFRSAARTSGRAAARDKLQKEMDIAAAMTQRRRMLALDARDKYVRDLMQYRTASGKQDLMRASEALFEDFGFAGFPSVRFTGEALIGYFHSEMAHFLDHFARKTFWSNASVVGGRQNTADLKDVQKALFGENAPPTAQGLAQAATHVMELARNLFNRYAGDTIPKLEDWGGPQSHNSDAVIRAGGFKGKPARAREAWGKFIDPLLNWEKMRDPFTGEVYGRVPPQDTRDSILGHAWDTIVTDGLIDRAPAARRVAGQSVATSRSDHRYFVFKDAESKGRYNAEFGTGDLFNQIMDHIHGMARDIALMHRFGPNPAAELEWIKQQISLEAAKAATGKPSMIEGYKNTSVLAKARDANATLDGYYEQYRGANAARGWVALAGTILRNNALGSLLGSSVIAHTSSNWLIQTFARKLGGIPAAGVIPQVLGSFRGAAKDEILRAGLDVENGMFHLGSGARQMGALAKAANWTRWLPDRVTHLSGLIAVVDANKAAVNRGMMAYLADMKGTDWANLPDALKRKLVGYGLREPDWKMIQLAETYKPVVGSAGWMTPRAVYDLARTKPEDVLRIFGRTDLAQFMPGTSDLAPQAMQRADQIAHESMLRLFGYMNGEREVAVPQHSIRAKQFIVGRPSGNPLIDFIRQSAGMFKGFTSSMMLSQTQSVTHMWSRTKIGATAYVAAFVASMTLMGMLTLQLKQMAAGKDALPMNPFTRAGMQTWAHALLTSGSFGVFGDFLASDVSSYGRGMAETALGPAAMLPLDILQGSLEMAQGRILKGAVHHKKPFSEVISDTITRFLKGNTPILSTLWYTRAAYQRIMLDTLQYALDNEAHVKQSRAEERLHKETGQYMWWEPGHMLPSRLPRLITKAPPQ